jgi:ribosome assembly protein YihI (activator of Der GTPase)
MYSIIMACGRGKNTKREREEKKKRKRERSGSKPSHGDTSNAGSYVIRGMNPQLHNPHPVEVSWDCKLCDEAKLQQSNSTTPTHPEITLGVYGGI